MDDKPADRTRRQLQATGALNAQVRAMSGEIDSLRMMLDLQVNRLTLAAEIRSATSHNQRDARPLKKQHRKPARHSADSLMALTSVL